MGICRVSSGFCLILIMIGDEWSYPPKSSNVAGSGWEILMDELGGFSIAMVHYQRVMSTNQGFKEPWQLCGIKKWIDDGLVVVQSC